MSRVVTASLFAIGLLLAASSAQAGGWSGGDSSSFRSNFKQGHTLKRVFTYLDDR